MKNWEKQLMQHILNEKYLGETDRPKMQKEERLFEIDIIVKLA